MSSDRASAYHIFAASMELQGSERHAHVEACCRGKPELLREVVALLMAADPAANATQMLLGGADVAMKDHVGLVFGQFRLVERLGAGGMGVVYRAERIDDVPQAVAVKLLRGELTAAASARFLSEAKLLARLEHPAIARLIDVGVKDGEAWIAIELVRGEPIDQYCAARDLPLRERIRLLATVAEAVMAAHRVLVVHRDIKPSNVLVTAAGYPKLIDFGIGSALTETDQKASTAREQLLFTPHFAAPEQVRGEPPTVATDVYGLGALAYQLLTGQAPYPAANSALTYLHAVTTQDVEPPSRVAPAGSSARALRGDLDALVCKAMQREPRRRYATVQDLSSDLNAWLTGLPLQARGTAAGYRLAKFVRRRSLAVGFAAVLALGLGIGGAVYLRQQVAVTQAREAAARRGEFLENLLRSADPHQGRRDITVAELLDSAANSLDQSLRGEPAVEASMFGLIADTDTALARFQQGLAASDRQLQLLKSNGASSLDLARALISRGDLLRAYGRYSDGIPVLREAVARLRALSGVDADYAEALDELGQVLVNTNQEREAEQIFRQAIALDQRGNRKQQVAAAVPMQNLAVLYGNEGRYAECAQTVRQALELARTQPRDDPDMLNTEATYAMALLNLHQPTQAEPILRDIVQRSTRVRGPEHTDTLVAQAQLGEVLNDLNRFAEAETLLRQTATTLDRTMGVSDRYSTGTWSDFAVAACSGNDAAAGLEAAQRIAAIRARSLPVDDWHNAGAQTDIGLCLVRLHQYAKAEPILLNAAQSLEASRGRGFYTTQLAYKALDQLYTDSGRADQAALMAAKLQN